jgi:hypothetical protein
MKTDEKNLRAVYWELHPKISIYLCLHLHRTQVQVSVVNFELLNSLSAIWFLLGENQHEIVLLISYLRVDYESPFPTWNKTLCGITNMERDILSLHHFTDSG